MYSNHAGDRKCTGGDEEDANVVHIWKDRNAFSLFLWEKGKRNVE